MDLFFTTSGSSPPQEGAHDTAGHGSRPQEQEGAGGLPEELVEALAALLAQALVNDIRQYPNLRDLTPDGTAVAAPPGAGICPKPSHRNATRTQRPGHAS
jgi:hypothetical protein